MRWFVTICLAIFWIGATQAQDQERQLVDRLLRPDMTLQNKAQNKKFVASSEVIERRGTVGTFYLHQKPNERSFIDTRDFSAHQFTSGSFQNGSRSHVILQSQNTYTPKSFLTSSVSEVHDARDAQKNIKGRNFAGKRPYLEQGKSQKSLDRQNPPLTIEQVRELLNKNK